MKANYTKPLLAVEVFSYAQSTTHDCMDSIPKDRITYSDPNGCGWDVGGGIVFFLESGNVCTMNGEGMTGLCYNNPSEGNYIFRS